MAQEITVTNIDESIRDAVADLALHFKVDAEELLRLKPPTIRVLDYSTDFPFLPLSYSIKNREISLYDNNRISLGHEVSHYLHHQINPPIFINRLGRDSILELVAYWGQMLFLGGKDEEFVGSLLTPEIVSLDEFARMSRVDISGAKLPAYDDYKRIIDSYENA